MIIIHTKHNNNDKNRYKIMYGSECCALNRKEEIKTKVAETRIPPNRIKLGMNVQEEVYE